MNAGNAAMLPGAVAMKFVALAETGDKPASINAGKVKKVAPPAIAFNTPAKNPITNKSVKSNISKNHPTRKVFTMNRIEISH